MDSVRDVIRKQVVRGLIATHGNLSIGTSAKLQGDGIWVNGDFAYEQLLVPLLQVAERIHLFGY